MTLSQPTREPRRIFLHLLPCLALAVVCTVLFWWRPFGTITQKAYFEALVMSEKPGTAELHYDVDGSGFREGYAEPQRVQGTAITHLRFQMPPGKLAALNFIPRVEEGEDYVLRCWVSTDIGDTLAVIPLESMARANPKFSRPMPNGSLLFHSRPKDEMNGLRFQLQPPLELAAEPTSPLWQVLVVFVLSLGGTLAFSLWLGERVVAARWIPRLAEWSRMHPQWALLCAAACSVTLSCFPVIFCGKSFVSPDNGLILFYPTKPTVPGGVGGHVDNALGSDLGATLYWHLPVSMIEHRAIFKDHEFPLWNRYDWCGLTLLGQSLSMIGDPLDWIAIVMDGAPWAWDLKFVVAQLLFAFSIGWLVRRSSGNLAAAVLLTLSAPFMGFFAYRYNHAAFFSLCYSPWILVAWIEGTLAADLRRAAAWALFLIFADWWELNSGTAKEMSALLLFLNLAGGLVLLLAAQPVQWRVRRLAVFAWANVIFLLLSAPLWMTFLDALGRAHTSYGDAHAYQITPGLAIGLFDDIFYRQFMSLELLFNPSTNFFVLIGAMWALARVRSLATERLLWAMTLPAIVAAVLAFGVIPPDVVTTIPFLKGIYHLDNTFSCVLFILLFVIAGFGLRECLARMREPGWVGDWLIMLTFVGVLVAAYFGLADASHRVGKTFLLVGETIPKSPFFKGYALALLVALVLLPLAWRMAWLRRPAATAWAVVAICAFVTLLFRHGMYLETKFDYYVRNPKTRTDLRHLTSPGIEAVRTASTEPGRVAGLGGVMMPGFNAALGFETISGPDALMNPAMLQLVDTLGFHREADWRIVVPPQKFPALHRALDMLNVRYLLDEPGRKGEAWPGTKVLSDTDLTVFESETAWPRAFFTDALGAYKSGAELRHLVEEGDGRPFAVMPADLRGRIPLPPRDFAHRVVQAATHYHLTNNTTSFEIDAAAPGMAVLMEANMQDDILATVDDEPVQSLPINHAFRGVLIEKPGHHVVKFEYWPLVFDRALSLALIGLVALLLSFWAWWRAGRATPGTPPIESAPQEAAAIS